MPSCRVLRPSSNTQQCVQFAAARRTHGRSAMNHLTRNDYASALRLLSRLEAESGSLECFAKASVEAVGDFVASEITTLSVCDLVTGHREVVGLPARALAPADIQCFD